MIRFFDKGEGFDIPSDIPDYLPEFDTRDIRAVWIANDRIVGAGYADPPGENDEHSRLAALVWLFSNMKYQRNTDLKENQREAYKAKALEALREYEKANDLPAYYKEGW